METLAERLTAIRRYSQLVAEDKAPPISCTRDDSVALYYVNDSDEIYMKCVTCGHIYFPGTLWWNDIFKVVENGGNHLG